MEKYKIIRGNTEEEMWNQVKQDLAEIAYPYVYDANVMENDKTVFLSIQADLGGGFESGFQSTSFTAPVAIQFTTLTSRVKEEKGFRFALHDEDFIDKVGKFFGMEDVKTGYPEFDKKLIVKTNDIDKVKTVFSNEETRKTFQSLGGFNLHIAYYDHNDKHSSLELTIDRDITNVEELRSIYKAFISVIDVLEQTNHPATQ